LIGIPFRVNLGKKLSSGLVELVDRRAKTSTDVPLAEAATLIQNAITAAQPTTNH
jgi:hypothetical protein